MTTSSSRWARNYVPAACARLSGSSSISRFHTSRCCARCRTYRELMYKLFAYDLVGFQTESDRGAFLEAVRAVGTRTRSTRARSSARGRRVRRACFRSASMPGHREGGGEEQRLGPVRNIARSLHGRRLIIGVDRLDTARDCSSASTRTRSSSRIFRAVRAGDLSADRPARPAKCGAYTQIRDSLEQSSGRTNGRFADVDWTPIRYLNRNFPHATLMGFLRRAGVPGHPVARRHESGRQRVYRCTGSH